MPKLKRRSISQRNTEMAKRMRDRRIDDDFRFSDNRRRAKSHRIEREDVEFKTEENKRRAEALKISRQDDAFKTEEKKRRAKALKNQREDAEFKIEDNKRRAEAHQIEREDDVFKEAERRKNSLRMTNSRMKYKTNFDDMKSDYQSKIKEGPTHICSCCGGLWFDYSIREHTLEMLAKKGLKEEFIDTVCHLKHTIIKLCVTCAKDITSNKIPNLALVRVRVRQ